MADVSRRLQDLLEYPREGLDIELKGWLDLGNAEHKANLAQALLAMANHGGGFVVLGFKEENGFWSPMPNGPSDFAKIQDDVNDIIASYAEPAFHCDVYVERHPTAGTLHPIIEVPGVLKAPVRSKRDGPGRKHVAMNQYYIRAPGPKSRPMETGQEWDQLLHRCVVNARGDLVNEIRAIIEGAVAPRSAEHVPQGTQQRLEGFISESVKRWRKVVEERRPEKGPEHCPDGGTIFAYAIEGDFTKPSLPALLDIMRAVQGHETGWPPWWVPSEANHAPYPFENTIECSLIPSHWNDPGHADFWRASAEGMVFLWRGYQEDGTKDFEPHTLFDLTVPIWRVAETLLHAGRFAKALTGSTAMVFYRAQWSGLNGRSLTSWADPGRRLLRIERTAKQDAVVSEVLISSDATSSQLPELAEKITLPLFEVFDFYQPYKEMFREEIDKLLKRVR